MKRGCLPSRTRVSTFRFATVNLFAHFVRVDHFSSVLDEVNPDVIVALELSPAASEEIGSRFPEHHLVPKRGYSGWGVASRFPLSVEAMRPGWGKGGSVRLDIDAKTVHLAAIHILDPIHRPWAETAAIRTRQVDALLHWGSTLPDDQPQIVAGDLNASPAWEVYRRLAERWDDLIVTGSPRTRPLRTWGFPRGLRLLRIDHVLGSGLAAVSNRVVRVRGSDHAMVVVDLEID